MSRLPIPPVMLKLLASFRTAAGDTAAVVTPRLDALRSAIEPMTRRARPALAVVTGLGWTVVVAGLMSWWLGAQLNWVELVFAGTACMVLFVLCLILTIGRTNLQVSVDVEPRRVVVGSPAAGRVRIRNVSNRRLLPIGLELPIGTSAARFNLPTLAGGQQHEEIFVVPTSRRGVIPIGPATTVRGDPIGLLRRAVQWTKVTELYVHPVTVAMESLGTGLLRDLEGQTTNDISMSDLAFHTLRDYAPGDDRRYIHWRSSAKVGSSVPGGKFLVRQFLDTRRSHITVVVDGRVDSYRNEEEFETAISAGASLAVRAIRDEMETTVVVADQLVDDGPGYAVLDGFSRAQPSSLPLSQLALTAARVAPDTSLAFLLTGPALSFTDIQRAASHFSPEVTVIAVKVDPQAPASLATAGATTVFSLERISDLPALFRVGVTT